MEPTPYELAYANRTGRPSGPVVRLLGTVLRGVREVRAQADPYADAWHADNLEVLADPGRRWVALGDSMAQGVGGTTHRHGWAGVVARRLQDAGRDEQLVNLSATGARVPDVLEQQLPVLDALLARGEVAGVAVVIGSNDLFGRRRHAEALPEAMRELVDRLPDGAVVASLPQPRRAARAANRWIDAAAAAGRVRLVDLRVDGPRSWKGLVAADFFHPNDAGYEGLADAIEPVVRRALEGGLVGRR